MVPVCFTIVLGLAAVPCRVDAQAVTGLSFATPGARANAMGGTFIAVADDASAAIANPSGLVALTRPQVYLEFTSAEAQDLFAPSGVTPIGSPNLRNNSLSFFSVSAPVGARVTVGATRYQFFKVAEDADFPNAIHGSAEATGVGYSGSVAARINDQLRVGVTVGGDRSTTRVAFTQSGRSTPLTESSTEDTGVTAVFGALYQIGELVGVGASVTRGSENGQPNRFGVGISTRLSPQFLATVDLVRILSGFDVSELHAGGEYSLAAGANHAFVRAGAFFGTKIVDLECLLCEDNRGVTVGAGYTFGQRLQGDVAFVSLRKRIVASVAGRF
jgi:hypothetical protein